jgi:hypothetical protein
MISLVQNLFMDMYIVKMVIKYFMMLLIKEQAIMLIHI